MGVPLLRDEAILTVMRSALALLDHVRRAGEHMGQGRWLSMQVNAAGR